MLRRRRGWWIGALVAGCACSLPKIPAHMADVASFEHFCQHFSVGGHPFDEPRAKDVYEFLLGEDAARVLPMVRPKSTWAIYEGSVKARGQLNLLMHLNPFDLDRFTVEGTGHFRVYTTERHDTTNHEHVLIDADFDLGSSEAHLVSQIQKRKWIILPIRHAARIDPSVFFGYPHESDAGAPPSDPGCVFPATVAPDGGRSVECAASGVGTPFNALYYVKIHLTEISDQVYAIDRQREHEVFREGAPPLVFGCLEVASGCGDEVAAPCYTSKVIDLNGRKEALKQLPPVRGETTKDVDYDGWSVKDVCGPRLDGGC